MNKHATAPAGAHPLPKHEAAPRAAGDAESFMRSQASTFYDVAEVEARDGAGLKRVGFTLRAAHYYREAADALAGRVLHEPTAPEQPPAPEPTAPEPTAPEPDEVDPFS